MYGTCQPRQPIHFPLISCIDDLSSLDALIEALDNLDDLFGVLGEKYAESLSEGNFERWKEES